MAFRCTIRAGTWPAPQVQDGPEDFLRCHVGYDDEEDVNYYLAVGLSPSPCGPELCFCIIEVCGETSKEDPLWHSADISTLIPREHRKIMRQLLLRMAEDLLKSSAPERFFMQTIDSHLPARALEKFKELCDLFTVLGYAVEPTKPYRGRHLWEMERIT